MKQYVWSVAAVACMTATGAFALDSVTYVSTKGVHAVAGSDLGWGTYTTEDGVDHDAYTNLQQAVSATASGGTVWVENGFVCDAKDGYSEASGKWCNSRLRIKPGVTVRSRSGHWTSGCVIEGSATGTLVGGVHFNQNDHSGKIIGFEIRNCERNNSSAGKAVYYGTISNCLVHTCLGNGSTLENTWAYDSVISNCWASSQGIAYNGALYNCEIVDIGKDKTTQVDGGQLVMQSRGNVNVGIVSNCTFRNCYGKPWLVTSKQVYSVASAPILMDCRFVGCRGGAVVGTEYGSNHCINLTNCVFTANSASCVSFSYVAGSRTNDFATCWNCVFTNNAGACVNGAGDYYNCLFANNTGAGGFIHNVDITKPLSLYNCTVVGNTGTGNYGTADGNTRAVNTILRGNTIKSGYADALIAATNCCLEDAATVGTGTGNIFKDAALIDPENGIYSPGEFSPCLDAGSVTAYELTPTDLAGRSRTTGGKVSIGAYEYDPSKHYLSGTATYPTYLYAPAKVTLAASVSGFGTSPLFYWDLDGDGRADEITTVPTLTHGFGIGTWSVRLSVSNVAEHVGQTIAYEPFTVTKRPVRYVKDGNANAAEPYDTEANAASAIQTAIDYCDDGDEVVILPGTYRLAATVMVTNDIVVHGSTGKPEDVVLNGASALRCLNIDGTASTIVHSLVLANGRVSSGNSFGGGALIGREYIAPNTSVYTYAGKGVLSNAVVRGCSSGAKFGGTAGVSAHGADAFVTHCVISNNLANVCTIDGGRVSAVGLSVTGGAWAENCLIAGNYTPTTVASGGLSPSVSVWNDDGTWAGKYWSGFFQAPVVVGEDSCIRFCTIVGNRTSFCGGVNLQSSSARFEKCVIAGNQVSSYDMRQLADAERYRVWSTFRNINNNREITFNFKTGGREQFLSIVAAEQALAKTMECYAGQTTNAVDAADCGLGAGTIVAAADKLVRDLARGIYRLPGGSPAIDVVPVAEAGRMAAGDLLGNPRLSGTAYDLGAYEKRYRGLWMIVY